MSAGQRAAINMQEARAGVVGAGGGLGLFSVHRVLTWKVQIGGLNHRGWEDAVHSVGNWSSSVLAQLGSDDYTSKLLYTCSETK